MRSRKFVIVKVMITSRRTIFKKAEAEFENTN
jgi:hypothetical protein